MKVKKKNKFNENQSKICQTTNFIQVIINSKIIFNNSQTIQFNLQLSINSQNKINNCN